MARERKTIIGDVPCPLCGVSCAVRAESGDISKTLGYPCSQGCDSPNWAPAGSGAHKIILSRMKPRAVSGEVKKDVAAVAVKPPAPPTPKAEEKIKPATTFG